MSVVDNKLFGWELLYNSAKNDIKGKKDLAALLIHFTLMKSNFRCTGAGETNQEPLVSELLPLKWNEGNCYILKYIRNNITYTLRSCDAEENLVIFNLLQSDNLKVSNVVIKLDDLPTLQGPFDANVVPKVKELIGMIKKKLINELVEDGTKNAKLQTDNLPEPAEPNRDRTRRQSFEERSHLRIGRSDLDPFAPPDAGGMLFDPFNDHRRGGPDFLGIPGPPLPRGAVPPGARFDPIGPPDNAIRPRRPFPDMDNMFM